MALTLDNAFQDIQAAVKTCLQKYADISGRAGRPEFWWFFVAQLVAYIVASLLGGWLDYVVMLALLLPSVAVGVRRLHDTGKTGWLMLIAVVPLLGALVVLYLAAQPGEAGANTYGEPVVMTAQPAAPGA